MRAVVDASSPAVHLFAALLAIFLIAAPCIAIDPGHGGSRDDGTTTTELKEKHLTLQYARALADAVNELLPAYKPYLTREDDRELSLTQRAVLANKNACAVLVSLHVNGSTQPRMMGIETYYLDTLKARLPRRLRDIAPKSIDDASLITRELKARHLAERSAALAGLIHEGVMRGVHTVAPEVRSNGARHDLLQLLLAADMPSVLVEVGYLSNPGERAHIVDKAYQRAVARGIAQALQSFLASTE